MSKKQGPKNDAISRAGLTRIPGPTKHYRDSSGKEYSYRAAFKIAHGKTLERATQERNPGKFRDELRTAERVRFLAKEGLLSKDGITTQREERQIARSSLRQLTKGHYATTAVGEFERTGKKPERESAYSRRILAVLHAEPVSVEAMPNESGASIEARQRAENQRVNGPSSEKANLLVALGYRDPAADYDVGETP